MSRVRRVLSFCAGVLATGVGFLLLVVFGLVLQLNVPAVRRVVAREVNELVLGALFKGKIEILSMGHLDAGGVSDVDARIVDPTGRTVIAAEGLHARIDTFKLVTTLLFGHGNIVVALSDVRIRNAEVRLDADDAGIAIAETFEPKHPSTKPSAPSTGGTPHVYIPQVHIDHAWGHGQMWNVPYFDDELEAFDGAFSFTDNLVSVDAKRGKVVSRGIALGSDAAGAFSGHFEVSVGATNDIAGSFVWDGSVGGIAETASGGVGHGRFDASLDIRNAPPDAIRNFWHGSPITGSASVQVEAHGPLDKIALSLHAGLDAAMVEVQGELGWGSDKRAKVHIDADAIDLVQVAPAAGPSRLGLKSDVDIVLRDDGRVEGDATLDLSKGHVRGISVPHTSLKTNGFRNRDGSFGGDAAIVIEEPGAPTTVSLHAVPEGHSSTIGFTVETHAVRLGSVGRLSAAATGSAEVIGRGNIDLERLAVEVAVDTRGSSLEHGQLHIGAIAVKAHAHGNLMNPIVDVDVHASSLTLGDYSFVDLDIGARGRALTPHVTIREHSDKLPSLSGAVDVDLLGGPSFSNVDIMLSRTGEDARVQAKRVRILPGGIAVDDAEIHGLGAPLTGSFAMTGRTVRLNVDAPRLEVLRVARFVGMEDVLRAGTVSVQADLALSPGKAEGHAKVAADGLCVGTVDGITGHVDAALNGREVVGTLNVAAADIGSLVVDAHKVDLGGEGPVDRRALWRAWGDVDFKVHADLAKLAARVPEGKLPVGALRGMVDIEGKLGRDSAKDFTPLVEFTTTTTNFVVSGKAIPPDPSKPNDVAKPPAWTVQGIDTTTTVHVNGDTGAIDVVSHLRDAHGDLAVVKVRSKAVPYQALYASPGDALSLLQKTAFDAHVSLPPRRLSSWPSWLVQRQIDGELRAELSLHDTLALPSLDLTAVVADASPAAARLTTPLDLTLHATYDGEQARVTVKGSEKEHDMLTAEVLLSAKATDLLDGTLGPTWKGSAKVHVDEFPLVTIGALDDRQIRGRLTGDVSVDGLHDNARAAASLRVIGFRVGEVGYKNASLTFLADGKEVTGQVWLDQDDGLALAKAHLAATWGAALLPKADPASALDVTLEARHFRAATLLPFIQGVADELDGRIDADAHLTFDPSAGGAQASGTLQLTDGLIELGAFGGEFHDIAAKLTLSKNGVLTLDNASAAGISGKLVASGSAQLHGLALESAKAVVDIPKKDPLPLSVNGAQLATLDGHIDIGESLSADRHTLELKVGIPTLHVVLPEAGSQDVQSLGPIEGVRIGTRATPDGAFIVTSLDPEEDRADASKTRPEDAIKVEIKTHLGDDVMVRRGSDLKSALSGDLTILVTDATHINGVLHLHDGSLDLYGKKFEIEQNSVLTFVGDPSNPQANVRASWTAGDGTHVNAEFVGPLKTGKVNLTSDTGLTKNEIVQLILFGSDPTQGQASSTAGAPGTSSAEGLAGAAPAQALNHALGQMGLSRVSAKIDTSQTVAKPEVEVQIAKDISIKLAVLAGQPPPGSNPDTTFLAIDWRIVKKLSLESTVGNAGSTIVDMVWRYRY